MRNCHSLSLLLITTALSVSGSMGALAQIPSAAQTGHIAPNLKKTPDMKKDAPVLENRVAVPTHAQSQAAKQVFTLGNVKVEGVTVYPKDHFKPLFAGMVGKKTSVADIQKVAAQITRQYRADGYVLTVAFVPTQNVGGDGMITIRVNEGYVSNLVFAGASPNMSVQDLTKTYAQKIQQQRPLKSDALERYLLLINDLPGMSARGILRPKSGEPGASELVVLLDSKPMDAMLDINNRSSRYIGPWQTSLIIAENGQLGLDERTTLRSIVSSNTKELRYISIQEEVPVGAEGTVVSISGSHARTQPGDTVAPLDVRGESNNAELKVIHPVLRSRLENLNVRASVDAHNSITNQLITTPQSKDRVRSVRVGATYDVADQLQGVNLVDVEVSQGVKGLGATDDGTGRSRIRGEHGYTKVALNASRTQLLPANFSLVTSAAGQYAFDPLLASEQMTLGGPAFGTAYDPAELSGDHGVAGKAELRYGEALDDAYVNAYQLYTYYDIGVVWLKKALASEQKEQSLSSAGAGVRVNFANNISGNVEMAAPLTKDWAVSADTDLHFYGGMTIRY